MSSNPDAASIFGKALQEHLEVIRKTEAQFPVLEAIAQAMTSALRAGGKILWCGNGGRIRISRMVSWFRFFPRLLCGMSAPATGIFSYGPRDLAW